jgi:predicted transcriptional regulator
MPIGIVSNDDFEDELKHLSPSSSKKESHPPISVVEIIDSPSRGRKNGDNNVPDSLRKIIGETAVIDGRQAALDLAKDFGISPSSVSAYAKGATSTTSYNSPNKEIISHINKSRARAIKRASKTLNAALGAITQEKLDYADAKDLSGIAKDMAVVIKNLEPDKAVDPEGGGKVPQFVIYAPQFRDERSFEVINQLSE